MKRRRFDGVDPRWMFACLPRSEVLWMIVEAVNAGDYHPVRWLAEYIRWRLEG